MLNRTASVLKWTVGVSYKPTDCKSTSHGKETVPKVSCPLLVNLHISIDVAWFRHRVITHLKRFSFLWTSSLYVSEHQALPCNWNARQRTTVLDFKWALPQVVRLHTILWVSGKELEKYSNYYMRFSSNNRIQYFYALPS